MTFKKKGEAPGTVTRAAVSVVALAGLMGAAPGEDLASQIRQAANAANSSSPAAAETSELQRATVALEADAPLVALELMGMARRNAAEQTYAHFFPEKDERTIAIFKATQKEVGHRAVELMEMLRQRPARASRPAVVNAWVDIALSRQKTFRDAAPGYKAYGYDGSAFRNLIASLAHLEEASFLAEFEEDKPPSAPTPFGLEAAIDRVEADVLQRFTSNSMDDVYPPTVVANSLVDFSRKLIASGNLDAAVLSYLEAETTIYGLTHEDADAVAPAEITRSIAIWNDRIGAIEGDRSIAQYFLETARFDLAEVADAEATRPDAAAEAALYAALPAYFALIEGEATDEIDALATNNAPVSTITLTRYPYT